MSKITLNNLADLNNSNTAINTINNNNVTIQTAFDNTLSLDGTSPNSMQAVLDMNGKYIINLPQAVKTGEAVEYDQFVLAVSNSASGAASIALTLAVASASNSATSAAASASSAAASVITAGTAAATALFASTSAAISAQQAAASASSIVSGGVWNNHGQLILTADYTVGADNTKSLFLGNGSEVCFNLFFGNPSAYGLSFVVKVINTDATRAKIIHLFGQNPFFLWPGASGFVWNDNQGMWATDMSRKWFNNTGGYIFYVDPNVGSDANDGLAPGAGNAIFSIQTAIDRLHQFVEPNNFPPTINLANGTYNVGVGVNCDYVFGPSEIFIVGNVVDPSQVVVSCDPGGTVFNCQEPATYTLRGMTISTTGNGSNGIFCRQHTTVDVDTIAFNAFPLGIHIQIENHGSMNMLGDIFINGAAVTFLSVSDLSFFTGTAFAVIVENAGLVFDVFIESERNSIVQLGTAWLGFPIAGQKYDCSYNALIDTNGTTIPGTIAGAVAQGGIVV